ncbi:MAG: hypothetical protein SP1CHLAM54_10170 [Chlamydiia bacterium]|nr:hypothetical protein [Chlamydiia bacterium]MCH9615923.1 hypothetical protein [Chlamydiia bacterium]MCH9628674.1 hypothetical protein [Chlamydiia bacterium]
MSKCLAVETLDLDVISYEDFVAGKAHETIESALHGNGIIGIKGIPTYKEKSERLLATLREFHQLPEEVKEQYAPDRTKNELFDGYEVGKERFLDDEGNWVVDDLKVSYYVTYPQMNHNKWPRELDLKTPCMDLSALMSEMGIALMREVGLIGEATGIEIGDEPRTVRMLYYRKGQEDMGKDRHWCADHFDHGMFTVLLPSIYFVDGEKIDEPLEAGLFVEVDGVKKKVVANDPDVLLFQVGEFGQLATNDAIRATKHSVNKAIGPIERFTMAFFFNAPMDSLIHSTSELTSNQRYPGEAGDPCTYGEWHENTFNLFLIKDES